MINFENKLVIFTMIASYFVTTPIDKSIIERIIQQLNFDLINQVNINQIFFYSCAVFIATEINYSSNIQKLIEICDTNNIDLSVCGSGFQIRKLQMNSEAQQDFLFKGLGQFIAETKHIDIMRHF